MLAVAVLFVMGLGVALNAKALGPSIVGAVAILTAGADETRIWLSFAGYLISFLVAAFRD